MKYSLRKRNIKTRKQRTKKHSRKHSRKQRKTRKYRANKSLQKGGAGIDINGFLTFHEGETLEDGINSLTRDNTIIKTFDRELTGTIPETISTFINLGQLVIAGTRTGGDIPESICNLPNLTHLILPMNRFTGNIPESIGSLTSLIELNFSRNQLSGPIPESIGALTNLTYLNLSGNQFSGEGFEHICQLHNLQRLNVDNFWDAFELPPNILALSDQGDELQMKLQFIRDALDEESALK